MGEEKEMDNAERLAVVETELRQLNKTVNAMNDKLDIWNQTFVPRNEIDERFESVNREIKSIKKANFWAWGLAIPSFISLISIGITLVRIFVL